MSWTDERIERLKKMWTGRRDRQPDRRRARRSQPQCRDRQGAPPRPQGAPVAGQARRGEGSEAGRRGRSASESPRPPSQRRPPRRSRSPLAAGRARPRRPGSARRAARRSAPSRTTSSIARSARAASSARVPATSRRRSRRRRRAAWSRPSRARRSPTRPACSISTTGSANGRWAIRASPTSTSAATRRTRASPIASQHCGVAYQAQLPRRDRRPPPPLPFGGPRVR